MKSLKSLLNKKSTKVVLAVVLVMSIVLNVVQIVLNNNLRGTYQEDSVALEKFRDLQNKQIDEAVTACNKARGSYGEQNGVKKITRKLFESSNLLSQYVEDETMGSCYSAVFTLLGEKDLESVNEYRIMQVSDELYVLKDGIFDEVKW